MWQKIVRKTNKIRDLALFFRGRVWLLWFYAFSMFLMGIVIHHALWPAVSDQLTVSSSFDENGNSTENVDITTEDDVLRIQAEIMKRNASSGRYRTGKALIPDEKGQITESPQPEETKQAKTEAPENKNDYRGIIQYSSEVKIRQGEQIIDTLQRAGIEEEDARIVIQTIIDMNAPELFEPGREIQVFFEEKVSETNNNEVESFFAGLAIRTETEKVELKKNNSGTFVATKTDISTTKRIFYSRGTIKRSFYTLASALGVPSSITSEMVRAYSYDVDFQRDVGAGSSFEVLFEGEYRPGIDRPVGGKLLYTTLQTIDGKKIKAFRFSPSGRNLDAGYYSENGASLKKSLLRTPVNGASVTSKFGMRRHPVLGYTKMHKGIDFGAPTGTPIYAAGDGIIEYAGFFGGYGRYVRIKHGNNYSSAYGHMSRISKQSAVGARVEQGDVIGYVGTSGVSTGPHLHFEVLKNGGQINPLKVSSFNSNEKLQGKQLANFKEYVGRINGYLSKAGGSKTDSSSTNSLSMR
jgi:murein DD-endopeptidase MepM/ murein hydrolase activator NlpD